MIKISKSLVYSGVLFVSQLAGEVGALDWKTQLISGVKVSVAGLASDASDSGNDGFQLLPPAKSGVVFTNVLAEIKMLVNQNLLNGSGVALGDYDGDGLCDIYLTSLSGDNALYKNLGNLQFRNVTQAAGVGSSGMNSTGAVFADTDGDDDLDLIVTSMGNPNLIFVNQGNGRFAKHASFPGNGNKLGSNTIALGDVDGDGDLDMYISNFGVQSLIRSGGLIRVMYRNGKPIVRGRHANRIIIIEGQLFELGEEDYFYLNDGKGNFQPQSFTGGMFLDTEGNKYPKAPLDQGLCVTFRDINGDLAPDLYICNDSFTTDKFFINDGMGTFREIDTLAFRKTPFFSMGADFADVDRDGDDDFVVVDMLSRRHVQRMTQRGTMPTRPETIGTFNLRDQVRRNNFYENRGDGTFAEIANFSGLSASGWTWAPVFMDIDLDGYEDLLITNGFLYDVDDMDTEERLSGTKNASLAQQRRSLLSYPQIDSPNYAFKNLGNFKFEEVGAQWGFDSQQISNGLACADFDNDGDLDLVVNNINGPAHVYQNTSRKPRIAIRLAGNAPNTRGVGARVTLTGGPVSQSQEFIAGGRYVSGDDYLRVFAANASGDHSVTVRWRDGSLTSLKGLKANHAYTIYQEGATVPPAGFIPENAVRQVPDNQKYFTEASAALNHNHHEVSFDDFSLQPLLPRKLSQDGPPVAVADWDGDGLDDLAIGAGKGGTIDMFASRKSQNQSASFRKISSRPGAADDSASLLGIRNSLDDQNPHLIIGERRYEYGPTGKSVSAANGRFSLPRTQSSGILVSADFNGDGRVDIFVGGGPVPGEYPESSPSEIYMAQSDGGFGKPVILKTEGYCRGAAAGDLNGDGWTDLVVAHEWGTVNVFLNQKGQFVNVTDSMGLAPYTGLWQSVALVDTNHDGKLDIVAGNWGLNDYYSSEGQKPMRLFYEKAKLAGGYPLVESWMDVGTKRLLPYRDRLMTSRVFPELTRTVPSHHAYGQASLEEIYGPRFKKFEQRQCDELRSCIFVQGDNGFSMVPLPDRVQYSPVFSLAASDWNGDGLMDLFVTQNFFPQQSDAPTLDAGRGLLLWGLSDGNFSPVHALESGIEIYGEQRGAAWGDFNGDFKADLVVTQNAGPTSVWINRKAPSGCRVVLNGPAHNPDGLGASITVDYQSGKKAVIPIAAGGGFNSQSAVHPILGSPSHISGLTVKWPGGKVTPLAASSLPLKPGTTISLNYQ